MPEWSGQRQFPRYQIQLPLLHKLKVPATSRVGVGWTRDLSEGGACAELAERLQSKDTFQVRLQTDQGPVDLEAQMVWVGESVLPGGGILHGMAVTHIAPDQLQALRELLLTKGHVRQAGVRLPFEVPVTCRPKWQAGQPVQGRTGDISRAGLLLYLPQALPPGTALEVTLHTAAGLLAAEGAVVWVAPPEAQTPGAPIRHGFRFTALGWSTTLSLGLVLAEPL